MKSGSQTRLLAVLLAVVTLAAFGLAIALGYADEISNKVVDAIGDISGGVRLHSDHNGETKSK